MMRLIRKGIDTHLGKCRDSILSFFGQLVYEQFWEKIQSKNKALVLPISILTNNAS